MAGKAASSRTSPSATCIATPTAGRSARPTTPGSRCSPTTRTTSIRTPTTPRGRSSAGRSWCRTLTLAIVTGLSVPDVSQNAVANLGWDEVQLPAPVFAGDTIYAESEVLEVRPSASRPGQGLVRVRTRGFNQRDETVITYERTVLVYERARRARAPSPRRTSGAPSRRSSPAQPFAPARASRPTGCRGRPPAQALGDRLGLGRRHAEPAQRVARHLDRELALAVDGLDRGSSTRAGGRPRCRCGCAPRGRRRASSSRTRSTISRVSCGVRRSRR